MSIYQIFFFVKKILLISNKVYKDLKGNKRLDLKKKNTWLSGQDL